MSKLYELIEKMCPNGVKYLTLEKITSAINIGINPRKFFKLNPDDATGFYVTVRELNGLKGVKQYEKTDTINDEAIRVIMDRANIEKGDILFSNTGTVGKMAIVIETPENWGVNEGIYVIKPLCSLVDSRFLYYYLSGKEAYNQYSKKFTGSTLKHVTQKALLSMQVPVPPLEIQHEIVHILDSFMLLTTELIAKLTAELTTRKKQYNFYRDKLLTFESDIPLLPIKEVVKKSCAGATPAKGNSEYYEDGTIPWIRTQDVRFNEITKVDSFITEKAVEETAVKWIPENCVIVAISGATAGRCAINKIKATTNQHCLNMQIDAEKALYKYVYYCICSKQDELISKKQGARGDLNTSLILRTKIPVPKLEIQKKIVDVLDKFESICTDLNIGLPAEIEARQKQYEYYRDLLLTFAETGSMLMTDRQTDRQS